MGVALLATPPPLHYSGFKRGAREIFGARDLRKGFHGAAQEDL